MIWVRHAAQFCFALAALCFLALAGQYFLLALGLPRADADSSSAFPMETPATPSSARLPISEQVERLLGGAPDPTAAAPTSRVTIKALIYVASGRPRSEVFVNGRRVGLTPYLGDLDCTGGEPVKIDVLQPKGGPTRREVPCTPEIRVSTE